MLTKKYNFEVNENNPFDISLDKFESMGTSLGDLPFENQAYNVKKQTIHNYHKMLDIAVENREIIEYVFSVTIVDMQIMNIPIDSVLTFFFQSIFNRMIKTSKVIQDLSVQGSYIEAKSLLRNNFERAVLIAYFSKNIESLKEYLTAKNENNRKILEKYSMRTLVEKIEKDYQEYVYLCSFAHPNLYQEDLSIVEVSPGFINKIMTSHNIYDPEEFCDIIAQSNNLLAESFNIIFSYLKENLPKEKIDKEFERIFESTKNIKFIEVKS